MTEIDRKNLLLLCYQIKEMQKNTISPPDAPFFLFDDSFPSFMHPPSTNNHFPPSFYMRATFPCPLCYLCYSSAAPKLIDPCLIIWLLCKTNVAPPPDYRLFTHSLIRSLVRSLDRSLTRSFACFFVRSFSRLFVYSFIRLLVRLFARSFACSRVCLLTR